MNKTDRMNARDIGIRNVDDDFETRRFIVLNPFPDKKEFMSIDNYNMEFMLKNYDIAQEVYNISFDKDLLSYKGMYAYNALFNDDNIKKNEIYHTLYEVIQWIGRFQEEIGFIYDENASFKHYRQA